MAEMSDGFMLMVMMVVTRRWALDVGNPPRTAICDLTPFVWPMMDGLTRDRTVGLLPCHASLLFTL